MLTLDQLVADRRFSELDSSGQKAALDEFFASEDTDKSSGEAIDGAGILKSAITLGDRFENETPLRKPFVSREFEALDNFRQTRRSLIGDSQKRVQERFAQGLTTDSEEGQSILAQEEETFKKGQQEAANTFAATQLQINKDLAKQLDTERIFSESARSFLSSDPESAETQREREVDGVFDTVGEFVQDAIESDEVFAPNTANDEERAAIARRNIGAFLKEQNPELSEDELESATQQILDDEDRVRASETEGGFFTDRVGEVGISPSDLARLSESKIKNQVNSLSANGESKQRFLNNLSALRRGAAEQTAQLIKQGVESGDINLVESDSSVVAFLRFFDAESRGLDRDLSEDRVSEENFSDPDNVREVLSKLENSSIQFLNAAQTKITSNVTSTVGGAGSAVLSLFDDEASKGFAEGADFLSKGGASANDLRRLSGLQSFGSDLAGTIPDLLLAAAGGTGAKGVNALFGATGKTATRISLAGVSAGSGLGSGLKTFNEARAKGLDASDSFFLGAQSFLITAGVTALGGANSGVEGVLTGNALIGVKKEFKQYLGTVLKGATNDGLEELADSVISSLTVQQELNPDLTLREHIQGALHATALGASLGGGLPAVAGIGDLKKAAVTIPQTLTDEQIRKAADSATEDLLDLTEGDKTRIKLAEQQNRDRLANGEAVESVRATPTRPEGSSARLEEPTEPLQPEDQNNAQEKEDTRGPEEPDRDPTQESSDSGADQGSEIRSRSNRSPEAETQVTAKDLERAEAIAAQQSFSSSPIVRDAVRDGVIEELRVNPEASDAVLRRAGRQAATKASRTQKSQEGQEASGNVGRLVDDQGADIDIDSGGRDASQQTEASEQLSRADEAIQGLPQGQKDTLNLVAEGFTNVEIAERLGISENAVAKRLEKGRQTLRKRLEEAPSESVENTSELPQGANREVFDRAVGALKNDSNPAVQELANRVELVEQPSEAFQAAAKIGEFFGRRVLAVRGIEQNGVFTPEAADTLFINENADRAEFQVIAHEALHSFRITNPESYQALLGAVDADLKSFVEAVPSRSRPDTSEVQEEFLADFFADKITDKAFLSKLASQDPNTFTKFTDFVRNILDKLRTFFKQTKDLDTSSFIANIDQAEQALIDTLVDVKTGRVRTPENNEQQDRSELGEQTSRPDDNLLPENRSGTEEDSSEAQEAAETVSDPETDAAPRPALNPDSLPQFHQIQGASNIHSPKEQADLNAAKDVISEVFPSETLALTPEGEQAARDFIANLADPAFVKDLSKKVSAETINTPEQARAVVSAASESAFFNFASRYATNPATKEAGVALIYDGFQLRRSVYQEGTSGGTLEAESYERALFLRSLNAFPGGRIVELFRLESEGRLKQVAEAIGSERADIVGEVSKTDLDESETTEVVEDVVAQELAEERERIAKAEAQVRKAWRTVLGLIKGDPTASSARLENPTSDPFEDFENLVNGDGDLDAIAEAFDALAPQLEARIGKKKAKSVRAAAKKAVVDRIGASIIRRANNLGETSPKKVDPVAKEFRDFVKTRPSRDAFEKKFIELGGDASTASDVFDAQQKLNTAADAKATETEQAKAARKAERETRAAEKRQQAAEVRRKKAEADAQKLVDSVGEQPSPSRGQAEKAPTFRSLINEFSNLDRAEQTQAQLEAELSGLKNRQGNPLLTQSQVEQASTRAVLARQAAKDARAAELEAKDAKKRERQALAEEKRVAKEVANQVNKELAKLDAAKAKAQKAEEAAQKKVDELVSKLQGQVDQTTKEFRDSANKAVNEFLAPKAENIDPQALAGRLRGLFDKNGKRALTDLQIAQIVPEAVQARDLAAKAREAKQATQKINRDIARAQKLFDPAKEKQPATTKSVTKIILDEFINNPNRKIQTRDERIKFAEEILAEKTDLAGPAITRLATQLESKLADRIFEKKKQIAERILRTVGRGKGLTENQIDTAIRLQIFDPKSDFTTNVAALTNWQGMTQRQTNALLESQRRIDLARNSRVVAKEYQKMARIIFATSGNGPAFSEFANSWFKGAIFSAVSTQTTGILAGKSALVTQLATESAASLSALTDGRGVNGVIEDLGNSWSNWGRSFQDLLREAFAARDGSTFATQLNIDQENTGKKKNEGVDAKVHVDALTKVEDILSNTLPRDWQAFQNEKSIKNAAKLSKQLLRVGTLMRGTFRALGAVDSAVTKAYTQTQTNIVAFRENRRLLARGQGGISKDEFARLTEAAHVEADAFAQSLSNQGVFDAEGPLGSADAANLAKIVQRDRVQQIVFGGLVEAGVRSDIPGETLRDIQAKIGTGQFDGTAIAGVGSFITELGTKAQKLPIIGNLTGGVLLALRTPAVVADFLAWGTPGVNVKRTYDLINLRKNDPEKAAEVFGSISSDWVARRRIALAIASYPATALLAAMFAGSANEEDEDKSVWFTGDFPDDQAERLRWQKNKWQENMLILGPLRIRIDKGVSQELFGAAIIAKSIVDANNLKEGEELSEAFAKDAVAAALAFTPSLDQVFELGADVKRRSTSTVDSVSGFSETVAFRAVPFSGLLKTVKRVTPGKVDERNSFASLAANNPVYVFPDAEGVIHMENVMGERLDQSMGPGDVLRRLGVPIFWTPKEQGRDPVNRQILQDFADQEYNGGRLNLSALKKRFEQSEIEFTSDNIKVYRDTYIKTFKQNYVPNRDVLFQLDKDNYKKRAKTIFTRSRKAADQALGLTPGSRSN